MCIYIYSDVKIIQNDEYEIDIDQWKQFLGFI